MFAILKMRSDTEGFNGGFDVVGPFLSYDTLKEWAEYHLDDENQGWIAVQMESP